QKRSLSKYMAEKTLFFPKTSESAHFRSIQRVIFLAALLSELPRPWYASTTKCSRRLPWSSINLNLHEKNCCGDPYACRRDRLRPDNHHFFRPGCRQRSVLHTQ